MLDENNMEIVNDSFVTKICAASTQNLMATRTGHTLNYDQILYLGRKQNKEDSRRLAHRLAPGQRLSAQVNKHAKYSILRPQSTNSDRSALTEGLNNSAGSLFSLKSDEARLQKVRHFIVVLLFDKK